MGLSMGFSMGGSSEDVYRPRISHIFSFILGGSSHLVSGL